MSDPVPPPRARATVLVLAVAAIGVVVHQLGPMVRYDGGLLVDVRLRLWEWYLEGSDIAFSFARNWARGDGLVPWPGGERVEAYASPTWLALLALGELVGVDGFGSSKILALVCSVATVPLTWRLAREVVDDERSAWFAAIFLAIYPTYAFWNASGLENPLWSLVLAVAMLATVVEVRRGGPPWSAVAWVAVACTRPEGLLYAAWGGLVLAIGTLAAGRGVRPMLRWLVVLAVPLVAYHAVRYAYFAWPMPNLYYALLGHKHPSMFAWSGRGWRQVRGWAYDSGIGWFVPVVVAGLVGLRGRRAWVAVLAAGVVAIAAGVDSLDEVRAVALIAVGALLPLAAIGAPRSTGRILAWGCAALGLAFSIRVGGDWPKGYRFMSLIAVPLAVLFAGGVDAFAEVWRRRVGARAAAWVAPAVTIALVPGFFLHSEWFFAKRETGPFAVKMRVAYQASILDRLFVRDRPVRNVEVDTGAFLFWGDARPLDLSGRIDVPVAHHGIGQRAFTQEYVFVETRPELPHVHGGWASTSKFSTYPEWARDYVEVPGFPISTTLVHTGNQLRRDLVLAPSWSGPTDRAAVFVDGTELVGVDVPAAAVSADGELYLEVGVRQQVPAHDVRLLAFLGDDAGRLVSFDVPLGYDWVPPSAWRPLEVFVGRFAFPMPADLPPGTYDLGFVLIGPDGVIAATTPAPDPRFARGEARFADVVVVGPAGTGEAAADAALADAVRAAEAGDCDGAEASWRRAWQTVPATAWYDAHRPSFAPAAARCRVAQAARATSDRDAADLLAAARAWDPRVAGAAPVAADVADRLYAEGERARASQEWEAAYRAFDATLRADPTRSWARRWAEEARDHRLGIGL